MKRILNSTRERILSTAEQLFAESGIAATSMRSITAMARVNLAAVNYHFGSKDALIEAVYERRLEPLNKARLRNLTELENQYGKAPVPAEDLLKAFILPLLEISVGEGKQTLNIMRLISRTYSEAAKQFRKLFAKSYHDVIERYQQALGKSFPKLTPEVINLRLQFTIGAMSHSFVESELLGLISGETVTDEWIERQVNQLIPFVIAGFKAKPAK
ncbi:MAG: TetR/AcrR family transcriptional regulator [Gammaproteobacteria bacterium]|nr:TetR family transcriptional regulator [Gammaproteobacteria bacterium]NNC97355.1 TetR/AcrR family transcriptional regulator [Gammaproteobacteria bacterium]NNM13126.1 TetR/AcrR family transcriptional regulator [Gammaproteobacteria bacterium]